MVKIIWKIVLAEEISGLRGSPHQEQALNFAYHPDSPCIDAGDPDESDPDDTRSDIGAEYYSQSSDGDCNDDNSLDVLDIVFMINSCILLPEPSDYCGCGDLNNDGEINVLDIVLMVNLILMP